jgi:hypothetical protein
MPYLGFGGYVYGADKRAYEICRINGDQVGS